jgi:hypothetical protein
MHRRQLNWKDHADGGSGAHAARDVGGRYEIRRYGGPDEMRTWPDPIKPFHYEVRWYGEMTSCAHWRGYAMSLEDAKALAEHAHDLAWTATRTHVRAARTVVEEAHKKAPRESADFQARMKQAIRELNKEPLGSLPAMTRFKVERIGERRACDESFCGPDDWCVVAGNHPALLVAMGFRDKDMAESYARTLERDMASQ